MFKATRTIHSTSLAVIETFTYLESTFICGVSLDTEIHQGVKKASVAYGMLEKQI